MSYVSALHERTKFKDVIKVVERVDGKRSYREFKPDYSFYVDDPRGTHRTIFDTPVRKITPKNRTEFKLEVQTNSAKRLWESDLNYVYKCLATYYRHIPAPDLHIGFFDIEVDFDAVRGYAPIHDPFNKVTAITILESWTDKLITFALAPPLMPFAAATAIANKFENTVIFNSERELLLAFLDQIDDIDLLTGWNSGGYDIPYLVNRIRQVFNDEKYTAKLCLWGQQPVPKTAVSFNNEYETYELVGRVHLDMLQVYQKFTFEERHSYALNAIAEHELGEKKTEYDGTLDELYRQDFELFLTYNRQDVRLLGKLESKRKFIALANALAHDNTVLIPNALGTVAFMDQAILNRVHDLGMVAPNRQHDKEEGIVAGAYVADPRTGIHQWVGSIDLNSLYPSTIRALNMGIETIVGTIEPELTQQMLSTKISNGASSAEAWEKVFGTLEYQAVMNKEADTMLTIRWEHTNELIELSAEDVYSLVFESNLPWVLSANGIIFTTERAGIIPGLLADWYAERKKMQKEMRMIDEVVHGVSIPSDMFSQLEDLLNG